MLLWVEDKYPLISSLLSLTWLSIFSNFSFDGVVGVFDGTTLANYILLLMCFLISLWISVPRTHMLNLKGHHSHHHKMIWAYKHIFYVSIISSCLTDKLQPFSLQTWVSWQFVQTNTILKPVWTERQRTYITTWAFCVVKIFDMF